MIISDMTVLLCGSLQTQLGTKMPSGGGHIINAIKRSHYDSHGQLRAHLADFLAAGGVLLRVLPEMGLAPGLPARRT